MSANNTGSATTTGAVHNHESNQKTMNAMVLSSPQRPNYKMTLEQLRIPIPQKNEVCIKVKACGVCHSDLHVMLGDIYFPTPAVQGHEISGEIVSLGADVNEKNFPIGMPVISPFIIPCGDCFQCIRGKEDICETFFTENRKKGTLYDGTTRLYRQDGTPISMYSMGGLAEYCVVPTTAVFPVHFNHIPLEDLAIVGCSVFTAYGALQHGAALRAGESVAVVAIGGVGTNVLQFAKAFGAYPIIAIDINDEKLAGAMSMGATHTINSMTSDVNAKLLEYTSNRGADVCVEAIGKPTTIASAIEAVADAGRCVIVGLSGSGVKAQFEIARLVRRQVRIIGSYGGRARQDIPVILKLIETNAIKISQHITNRYDLQSAPQAFKDLEDGKIRGRAIVKMW